MFGKLSPDEFQQLRTESGRSSDEELQSVMEKLWNDSRTPAPLPAASKLRILDHVIKHPVPTSHSRWWSRAAAILLLPLLLAATGYWYLAQQNNSAPYEMKIIADAGQKTRLILPDGSKVWLNSQSSLTYPADFGKSHRTVRLTGEGYFEITKDQKSSFCVETEGMNVRVHGTKFNIAAHPGKSITQVSLIEGSISVENKDHLPLVTLVPRQTLRINKENQDFEIRNEDTYLSALWSLNQCRMDNATAEEVFEKIGYWYGLNIRLENKKTNYHYGFTIKEESFRELMELINNLTPLEYQINGEEVIVRYK